MVLCYRSRGGDAVPRFPELSITGQALSGSMKFPSSAIYARQCEAGRVWCVDGSVVGKGSR